MNAILMAVKSPRFFRRSEPVAYALLAGVLIGQVFLLDSMVTAREAAIVITGEVFGLMAACAAAPLTTLLQSLRTGGGSRALQTADILPFVRGRSAADGEGDSRRAA